MAIRDSETGRFVKGTAVVEETLEAAKCQAKDVLYKNLHDKVGDQEAIVTFREAFQKVGGVFQKLSGKAVMVAEFPKLEKTIETVVGEDYCFVPNNIIEETAKNLPGATVITDYFGMYFFGRIRQDDLTAFVGNSYGGARAFSLTPSIRVDNHDIPVFLKTKQIHSGGAADFEFRLKQTMEVAKALRDGKDSIRQVLDEPMSESDWKLANDALSSASEKRKFPKKITETYDEKRNSGELKSYTDVVVFIVESLHDYRNLKDSFSIGMQINAEQVIERILSTSKIAAKMLEAIGASGIELAKEASHKGALAEKKKSMRI